MTQTNIEVYRKSAYDIDEVFMERWSPRSFSDKPVSEETLLSLFEAAHWAPSAFNFQPWRFIVAQTAEEREKFYTFIRDFNLVWCKHAPVLTVILSKTHNGDKPFPTHSFDTGAAWGNLAIQATKKGLITHPMSGFDFEKAKETLQIPEGYQIECLVAIGYQDDKEKLPEKLQEREQPSSREAVESFIMKGSFK